MTRRLSEDEFLAAVQLELVEIDSSAIVPEAKLIADLGLDSLQLIRLVAFIESLAPIELPTQIDPEDVKVGDLFYYYDVQVSRPDSGL